MIFINTIMIADSYGTLLFIVLSSFLATRNSFFNKTKTEKINDDGITLYGNMIWYTTYILNTIHIVYGIPTIINTNYQYQ